MSYAVSLHWRQPDTKSDKQEAAGLYEKIIKLAREKHRKVLPLALVMQGSLYQATDYYGDESQPQKAYECFNAVIAECPKSNLIHYAALRRAQALLFTMQPDNLKKGIAELTGWLKKYPRNRFAAIQWLLLGDIYHYPVKGLRQVRGGVSGGGESRVAARHPARPFLLESCQYRRKRRRPQNRRGYLHKIIAQGNSQYATSARDLLKSIGERGR